MEEIEALKGLLRAADTDRKERWATVLGYPLRRF
jgi:hypothetical protein